MFILRSLSVLFLLPVLSVAQTRDACKALTPSIVKQWLDVDIKETKPKAATLGGSACEFKGELTVITLEVAAGAKFLDPSKAGTDAKPLKEFGEKGWYKVPIQGNSSLQVVQGNTLLAFTVASTKTKYTANQLKATAKSTVEHMKLK